MSTQTVTKKASHLDATKKQSKGTGKKVAIVLAVIAAIAAVGILIGVTVQAGAKNKQVDATAAECNEVLDKVTMDLTGTVDKNQAYTNVVELSVLCDAKVNEDSLVYFDGSKAKYNEVKDRTDNTLVEYKNYFNGQNEVIFKGADIDVNAASKDELNAAYTALTNLSKDIENTLNSTIWDTDKAWSMLWGSNEEEAKANYNDFKTKVDNKAAEIKTRLDAIAAEEANAAAAQEQQNAQSSSSNGSSSSYSGGSGYSGGGSGGGQGGGGVRPWDPRSLYETYLNYVETCKQHGWTPMSWEEFQRHCK